MKDLLLAIRDRLEAQLHYLSWVGILEDENELPATVAFPLMGVKDGGVSARSLPNRHDLESCIVHVLAYQRVLDVEVGASLLGSDMLGPAGVGLFDMATDIQTTLNDDFLAVNKIVYAHRDAVGASETLVTPEGDACQKQRSTFTYQRLL